jgi:cytochrome c oxidase assembly protein subunit 11
MTHPPAEPTRDRGLSADNRAMGRKLLVVAVAMFAFGYLLVPVYKTICDALGINVLSLTEPDAAPPDRLAASTQVDASRTVTVEFDANARGPWDFKPEVSSLQVHPGQLATVVYEFRNRQNRTMTAQAIPSYAPMQAMAHFNKLECFCFQQHTLGPGESRRWPVTFVIDGKLPRDVQTITLSYTFFEVGGKTPPEPQAQAPAPAGARS